MSERKKISEVINNISESSNKELQMVLTYLNEEFELTKKTILKLTNYLDNTESTYNKILKELEKRTKK